MKNIFSSRRNKNPHNKEETEKKEAQFFSKKEKAPFFSKVKGAPVQAKLTVGQPGDKYEKEADSMADAVVNNTATPEIQNKEISSIQRESLATPLEDEKLGTAEQRMEEDKLVQEKPEIQKLEAPEEEMVQQMEGEEDESMVQRMEGEEEEGMINKMEDEEEETVQTKSNGKSSTASPGLSQQIKSNSGKGRSLSKNTQKEMESSFKTDFSDVNIHTDQEAIKMNKELGAQAFTHGKDVYFNSGKYSPETAEGKRLLAHELTHVVQQNTKELSMQKAPPVAAKSKKKTEKEKLEEKYNINISNGDKNWSKAEIGHLKWVLSKMGKKERSVLRGYEFRRWSDEREASKLDATYKTQSSDECGLHHAFAGDKRDKFKIHMMDQCFKDPEAESDEKFGVDIGRFHLAHEIGHAMEVAELRKLHTRRKKLFTLYNTLYKSEKSSDLKKAKKISKQMDAIDKRLTAIENKKGTLAEFKKLVLGKAPLSTYSESRPDEALAEAYAIYKSAPEYLEKKNIKLYNWFKSKGHVKKM